MKELFTEHEMDVTRCGARGNEEAEEIAEAVVRIMREANQRFKDFESRTCKNCKWYDGSHKCNNENSIAYGTSNRVYSYDGCKEDFVKIKEKK